MLSIRLARTGRKNRPYFRVVVTQKHRDTYGKHIEILGNFDPYHKKETLTLKSERIQYWRKTNSQREETARGNDTQERSSKKRRASRRSTKIYSKTTPLIMRVQAIRPGAPHFSSTHFLVHV